MKHKSHLFYQAKNQRPILEHAEGVYMYDQNGKRYLDGSSGAMVSNIGHSNKRVLSAMQAQMEKATFRQGVHRLGSICVIHCLTQVDRVF